MNRTRSTRRLAVGNFSAVLLLFLGIFLFGEERVAPSPDGSDGAEISFAAGAAEASTPSLGSAAPLLTPQVAFYEVPETSVPLRVVADDAFATARGLPILVFAPSHSPPSFAAAAR